MNARSAEAPAPGMMELLEALSAFSAPGPGITRLLYTPEWCSAQHFLRQRMAEAGLEVTTDRVGNVFGRLSGSDPEGKVILTGSHIDTVRSGGKYDGAYGVAAAVTALKVLRERYGQPLRSLAAVSFCEEEGSRFPLTFWGSGHVTGLYDGSEAQACADTDGVTIQTAMAACGLGGGPDVSTALREDIGGYVELHIEQGIVLEQSGQQIGVVQAIAGQRRMTVKVGGTANHAGTTPMPLRRDALAGAAEMLVELERSAVLAGDPLVATSGRLETFPGTPNVIPGEVRFTLDIRHSEAETLDSFCAGVCRAFKSIADKRGLALEMATSLSTAPAPMDLEMCRTLEHICRKQGRSYRTMISGAGHDAQLFVPRCPTAMIFVPSRAGISHSPEEFSSPEELAAGLEVLIAMLYEMAYKES
ncbi:allantoate amidohydrolase [Paenibacillus sp. PK3_47]|uniref:M20 family metallo-hydrolase n=1 Tax=Paenibacillus sp. PK3_47 TaxID=2072642 RepID=UPI00201D8C21|nr:M20 family metallo-hydrolase [Paenibacillus sp. PK3_47]UQZ37589.1 allantoate amidohydrolase [Paenibacillus sp. PK3_47]